MTKLQADAANKWWTKQTKKLKKTREELYALLTPTDSQVVDTLITNHLSNLDSYGAKLFDSALKTGVSREEQPNAKNFRLMSTQDGTALMFCVLLGFAAAAAEGQKAAMRDVEEARLAEIANLTADLSEEPAAGRTQPDQPEILP
jgi:hypothetical protein